MHMYYYYFASGSHLNFKIHRAWLFLEP
jgi:hypothetical protein